MPASAPAALRLRWRPSKAVKQLPSAAYLPLLRQAVATAPHRIDLVLQLARTLVHTHRMAELVERFRPAAADPDAHPELLFQLGRAASSLGDDVLAAAALERSVAQGYGNALGLFAETLRLMGRLDDALDAGLRGLEHAPADFAALRAVARILLIRRDTERLWALCEDLRARGPCGAYLPSVMAIAATTARQQAEVAALIDPPTWFSSAQLAMPARFDRRLAAELLGHAMLSDLPETNATRGAGNRIDQLELAGGKLASELLGRVREAVEGYVAARPADASHPMRAHRSEQAVLNSWAVAVHDDGHETWHLHPDGWVSGVYYVQVPDVETGAVGHPGAIEFGPHPLAGERDRSPWPRWHVKPRPGMLLLFPSYYAHRTWPTGVPEPRLCIAFDVVPDAARSSTSEGSERS
jgi:tetratricopeptide (TPR) repeat protein